MIKKRINIKSRFLAVLFVARRYLTGKQGGTRYLLGSAFGIMLSLIPIVVTLIVADGMIWGITDRFLELGTGHIQIWDSQRLSRSREAGSLRDAETAAAVKKKLLELKGVRGVWEEAQGAGIMLGLGGKLGVTLRAADPSFWQDEGSSKYLEVVDGEAVIESERDALIGQALAEQAGVKTGSTIRIMTVRETADGRSIPRTTLFTVRGIVSAGYHELDSLWCLISYEAGKRILDQSLAPSYLMVKITEPYKNIRGAAFDILNALAYEYGVYTWHQLHEAQYRSYESTRQLLMFIMALIVLVAAVNLSSALSMLTIERYRDIAILKAAGISPVFVSAIFISAGLLTGFAGAAGGICAGLFIGSFINQILHGLEKTLSFFSQLFSGSQIKILDPGFYLENIPIVINWATIRAICLFTILSSICAAWFPAIRAGRQKPVGLLRKV